MPTIPIAGALFQLELTSICTCRTLGPLQAPSLWTQMTGSLQRPHLLMWTCQELLPGEQCHHKNTTFSSFGIRAIVVLMDETKTSA